MSLCSEHNSHWDMNGFATKIISFQAAIHENFCFANITKKQRCKLACHKIAFDRDASKRHFIAIVMYRHRKHGCSGYCSIPCVYCHFIGMWLFSIQICPDHHIMHYSTPMQIWDNTVPPALTSFLHKSVYYDGMYLPYASYMCNFNYIFLLIGTSEHIHITKTP